MAYKTVTDLSTDVTISLGGTNRKTGKKNPTSIEGYLLGKRSVPDAKKKSGESFIYTFQTAKGNVGVWGKTDLDRKLQTVTPGTMVRASYDKMKPTANGDMYIYKVEVDEENTVEVSGSTTTETSYGGDEGSNEEVSYSAADKEEDDAMDDDLLQAQALAAAERKAKVAALLNGKAKSKA